MYWLDFLKLCFGSYPSKMSLINRKNIQVFLKKNATSLIVWCSLLFFLIVGLIIKYDKIDKGTTGDSFNGLVGPFIALLSAILVYRSFVAQTEANQRQTEATLDQIETNKIIQSQWMYETYLSLFNDVKTSYNNIRVTVYTFETVTTEYFGEIAIQQYAEGANILKEDKDKLEKDLESVLRIMNYFFQKLTIIEIQEKDIMLYMVIEFYQTYMQAALIKFREKVIKDGRDTQLAETLFLINYSNNHYVDLLKVLKAKTATSSDS